MGSSPDAVETARETVSLFEDLPGPLLAIACDLCAGMNLLSEDRAETERWARRALDIATEVGMHDIASAVGILGAAKDSRDCQAVWRSSSGRSP